MSATSVKSRNRKQDGSRQTPPAVAISKWEWVFAGFGVLLVLGTVGYVGYMAVATEPGVPAVTVSHIATEPTSGGYVVTFRARNSGPSTAASLHITGELLDGSTVIEASGVVLDYLPARAERSGGLIFRNDPAGHQIRLEAMGYVDP